MDLRRLNYFVSIAEQGSLCRASDVLRIAQPALTRQMRLLEEEVGVQLFTRTRRGMHLTNAGEQLLMDVTGPLRQLARAFENVRPVSLELSGNIAVGLPPTVSCFLAQSFLERMSIDVPNVTLRIIEGTSAHLNDWLVSGEIDIAVLYGPLTDNSLRSHDLVAEEMVLVCSPNSNFSPDRSVSFSELRHLPLILANPRNGLRAISERLAARYKSHFNIKYVIDSLSLTKEMVAGGHGYTIMPVSAIMPEIRDGTLTYAPIENPITRMLVVAAKSHPRIPRIIGKADGILSDLFREVFAERPSSSPQTTPSPQTPPVLAPAD
jgi:LysR family nitrogen assimilation transcriptional regulator